MKQLKRMPVIEKHATAKYMYKCRLCGAQFFDGLEGSAESAPRTLQDIAIFGKDTMESHKGMSVGLVTTHRCHGQFGMGAEGLADLIGFMVEKQ